MTPQFYKTEKSLSQIVWKWVRKNKKYVYFQSSASLSQDTLILWRLIPSWYTMSLWLCFQWLNHNPVVLTHYKLHIVRLVKLDNVSLYWHKLYFVDNIHCPFTWDIFHIILGLWCFPHLLHGPAIWCNFVIIWSSKARGLEFWACSNLEPVTCMSYSILT